MPTLKDIKAQINALPHKYIFYTKKEIKYLPKVLGDNEQILALTSGFMNNSTWLAVCTNRRVIFLDKGMFFGLKQVQMNLDRIQTIDSSYTIVFGSIRLWDGASSFVLSMVLKDSIHPFVTTVRQAIDNYRRLVFQEMRGPIDYGQQSHQQMMQADTPSALGQRIQQTAAAAPAVSAHQQAMHEEAQRLKSQLGTSLKPAETPDLLDRPEDEPNPITDYKRNLDPYAPAQSAAPAAPQQPALAATNIAEQLEKLAKLKEAGHLTDEEFAAQKAKLLA